MISKRLHGLAFAALMTVALCVVGCSGVSGLERLDSAGSMEAFRPPQVGGFPMTTVMLPERARIQKIVVTPREPLRKFQVLVRTRPGRWDVVKQFTGRFNNNVTVSMDLEGDAVRIVNQNPAAGQKNSPHVAGVSGTIRTVLIYGHWLGEPPQ